MGKIHRQINQPTDIQFAKVTLIVLVGFLGAFLIGWFLIRAFYPEQEPIEMDKYESRIMLMEEKWMHGYGIAIIKIDNDKEYLITYKGGIVLLEK